jgi:formate dehydrogenase major subunit
MGKKDKDEGKFQLSRRDFLKVAGATTAAATAGLEFGMNPAPAMANYPAGARIRNTTCPYCSASCGQIVVVDSTETNVLDIYGDGASPWNNGGLCAKGAGAFQLVKNPRRLGAWALGAPELAGSNGHHPVNDVFLADTTAYPDGVAYRSYGTASGANTAWQRVSLPTALDDIAQKMKDARGTVNAANGYNSKGIAFLGSSHVNTEGNYLYRKIIANFGTSNVEHQARI